MRTLKETIMRLLGYRLIPQDHVILIEGDGQIIRWKKGPGYVRRNAFTEWFGPVIPIGFDSTKLALENVYSSDRIPVNINLKVLYSFDPDKCDMKERTIAMLSGGPEVLKQIVQGDCDQIVRHITGKYTSEELCSGSTLEGFERKIRFRLRDTVKKFGITLLEPNGVAVTISIPDELRRTYEEAAKQKAIAETERVIAEIAASMPAEGVERRMRANFAEKLSKGESSINLFTSGGEEILDLPAHVLGQRSTIRANGHHNGKPSQSSP